MSKPADSKDGNIPLIGLSTLPRILFRLPVERSVMVWGPPGVGKSQVIAQMAKKLNYNMIDLRMAQLDPVDIRGVGMPDLETQTCKWFPPEFLPRKEKTILFLDELTAAPSAIQAAGYQIVLDRRVGEHKFPPDCRVIAAGNRESDRGLSFRMPSPLANRFMHFEVRADMDSWWTWAMQFGVHHEVICFLQMRSEMLHDLNANNSGQAWPSPRSWEYVSDVLKIGLDQAEEGEAIAACVGKRATKEFLTYRTTIGQFPDPREILEKDNMTPPDLLPAPASNLIVSLVSNCSDDVIQINRALKYGFKMQQEYAVLMTHSLETKFGERKLSESEIYMAHKNRDKVGASKIKKGEDVTQEDMVKV